MRLLGHKRNPRKVVASSGVETRAPGTDTVGHPIEWEQQKEFPARLIRKLNWSGAEPAGVMTSNSI